MKRKLEDVKVEMKKDAKGNLILSAGYPDIGLEIKLMNFPSNFSAVKFTTKTGQELFDFSTGFAGQEYFQFSDALIKMQNRIGITAATNVIHAIADKFQHTPTVYVNRL